MLQIDFSINILYADASTPMMPFTLHGRASARPTATTSPFPVPAGGAVEGEQGYACTQGGDCHLLVVDTATSKLYEMCAAFDPPDPSTFNGGCGVVWDLTKTYPPNLRGDGCTSADAGGFPIAAMLFTADEVAAGAHRPRDPLHPAEHRIRDGDVYVHPGTHTDAAPTSGGPRARRPTASASGSASSFDVSQAAQRGRAGRRAGACRSTACSWPTAATSRSRPRTTASPRHKWTDARERRLPRSSADPGDRLRGRGHGHDRHDGRQLRPQPVVRLPTRASRATCALCRRERMHAQLVAVDLHDGRGERVGREVRGLDEARRVEPEEVEARRPRGPWTRSIRPPPSEREVEAREAHLVEALGRGEVGADVAQLGQVRAEVLVEEVVADLGEAREAAVRRAR